MENSESVYSTPSKPSTPKTPRTSPTSSRLLTPPSSTGSNSERTKKTYTYTTPEEKEILMKAFEKNAYLDTETRLELASKTNLTAKQLNVIILFKYFLFIFFFFQRNS